MAGTNKKNNDKLMAKGADNLLPTKDYDPDLLEKKKKAHKKLLIISIPVVIVLVTAIVLCSVFVPNIIYGERVSGKTIYDSNQSNIIDIKYDNLKIGLITLHDENSQYDLAFINALINAKKNLGIREENILVRTGIDESNTCYEVAEDLVEQGCNVIIADSYGHETYLLQSAKKHSGVQYFHYSGCMAAISNCSNFHNFYFPQHQNAYLAGALAGAKLKLMISDKTITSSQAKIGYVCPFPYAECISRYTAFYLGAKSICQEVTMDVKIVNSWYDETFESEATYQLIDNGAKLISHYSESAGPLSACYPNIPCITSCTNSNNSSALLANLVFDPTNLFEEILNSLVEGKELATDIVAPYSMGCLSVDSKESIPTLDWMKESMNKGDIKVFDTSTFKVKGSNLTSYNADVIYDSNWEADTQVIENGEFLESHYRSAPYFDILIDEISIVF